MTSDIKKYKNPITYDTVVDQDELVNAELSKRYKDELLHFSQTSELFISFFANSKRLNRDPSKIDNVQLISVRIFQDTRAALILTLKGLYPQAATLLRGVLESINLIYDFKINPENEDTWSDAGKNKREELFKSSAVRKRVKESEVCDLKPSNELYKLFSTFSVHTNHESHLWYVELKDKVLFYHWAGQVKKTESMVLVLSILNSLSQALFVLTYEGLYGINAFWSEDFTMWKKQDLVFQKKFAAQFGITDFE